MTTCGGLDGVPRALVVSQYGVRMLCSGQGVGAKAWRPAAGCVYRREIFSFFYPVMRLMNLLHGLLRCYAIIGGRQTHEIYCSVLKSF